MTKIKGPARSLLFGLYPIIDLEYISADKIVRVAREIISAGSINILQLRAKGEPAGVVLKAAHELRALTLSRGILFIINDRIDIALMSNADGVHLGLTDTPITEARGLLGEEKIIGLSTHNSLEALEAVKLGADYISFGPIFKTCTKLDAHSPGGLEGLRTLSLSLKDSNIPITAIGGITKESIAQVISSGASMAAVISDILLAKDPAAKVKTLINEIGPTSKVR